MGDSKIEADKDSGSGGLCRSTSMHANIGRKQGVSACSLLMQMIQQRGAPTVTSSSYEDVDGIAESIREKIPDPDFQPTVGIILGSGFGLVADVIEKVASIPYKDIPGLPQSTVAGHKGVLVLGSLGGTKVACLQGRIHTYEGYDLSQSTLPVRVLKHLGIHTLVATNAAGGLNSNFKAGDLMLLNDHICFPSFSALSPLRGPNDERYGPRFPSMFLAYDRELRKLAKTAAQELGIAADLKEGVYAMVGGPNYETLAENRALKILGADAVGMSTCHEVIVARHCGLRVLGLSLITNMCPMSEESCENPNHKEVLDVANKRVPVATELINRIITRLADPSDSE